MVNKNLVGQIQNNLNQIRTFAERLIRSDAECSIRKHSGDPSQIYQITRTSKISEIF